MTASAAAHCEFCLLAPEPDCCKDCPVGKPWFPYYIILSKSVQNRTHDGLVVRVFGRVQGDSW